MGQRKAAEEKFACSRITIRGIVQGVGFRPFVFNLASKYGLNGTILNSSRGVIIEIEGEGEKIEEFCRELLHNPPRLARISSFTREEAPLRNFEFFSILSSKKEEKKEALVPPDIACCEDCEGDMLNPLDRRYFYPFTNCTNCGPRFTLIKDVPYDRNKTSMDSFPMCDRCYEEYHDPLDRRFHAQPAACPECGPHICLVDEKGRLLEEKWRENLWRLLAGGKIIALKSLGGFHLCCDAHNESALKKLRERKNRPFKPFAVMMRDLQAVERYCFVGHKEEELLRSPRSPIVILQKKKDALPEYISPNLKTVGVMLPYTPLHFLLFQGPYDTLVMTSANVKDLPLVKDNDKALEGLKGIADCFLWHNRDIVNRCDDSLAAIAGGEQQIFRRSRGYVPGPLTVPSSPGERWGATAAEKVVLAFGAEMKNTFCFLRGEQAFLSQYIGEMNSLESEEHFKSSLHHFKKFFGFEPEILAYDLHPAYRSSALALEEPAGAKIPVQHHHAHMASCMAENGISEPVIGVILDGTGYGLDGSIWGFEILSGDYLDFERNYHLSYLPMPGGEKAVERPWRMAVSYLCTFLGEKGKKISQKRFSYYGQELNAVFSLLESGFNSPLTSSCGRLFDAVSALLGVCEKNTYEGQAAVELSEFLLPCSDEGELLSENLKVYPYEISNGEINPRLLWEGVVKDFLKGREKGRISRRFHDTLAAIIMEAVNKVSLGKGIRKVVLSGGVFHNRYLLTRIKKLLEITGFQVLCQHKVPPNDGGISLGQALIASWRWKKDVSGSSRQSNNNS